MPAKKQSDVVRLKKKAEAEKKRQAKIKLNPRLLEEEKEKRRQKYLNRKAKGQVKPIGDQTSRDQRKQRSRWRKNSSTYRREEAKRSELMKSLRDNSPPTSGTGSESGSEDNVTPGPSQETPASSSLREDGRRKAGRNRVRRDRTRVYRNLQAALLSVQKAIKKANKFKQKYYRLLNKVDGEKNHSTPRSASRKFLKPHRFVPAVIKKKLFDKEIMEHQLTDSYNSLKSNKSKQNYYKIFNGGMIFRKYRVASTKPHFLKYKGFMANKDVKTLVYQRMGAASRDYGQVLLKVKRFLETDECSRVCPGKKDTVTRKKVKKQKRYLNDTLKNLHKMFIAQHSECSQVSYARFCTLKPFWIVAPKVDSRETCACVIHSNMKLLIGKLKSLKVIEYTSVCHLVEELCCVKDNIDCLLRKCNSCKDTPIVYNEFEFDDSVSYQKWKMITEMRTVRGKEKEVKFIAKVEVKVKTGELVDALEVSIPSFMIHSANIKNQYFQIQHLKSSLTPQECLIHIDFSENYSCKYAEEAQSVHFGAARSQVTLHTGVFYHRNENQMHPIPESFCTLSESMRHDPFAIWAHLKPILNHIHEKLPSVNVIHFLSDSPSTQYRNQTIFFLPFLPIFIPNLVASTWNYSEAGHGKGAPDGIGGVLKRTADRVVAQGQDVPNFNSLRQVLSTNTAGIMLRTVTEDDVLQVSQMVGDKMTTPFKGTLKVHQLTWNVANKEHLHMRSLSCFEDSCGTTKVCPHFHLGTSIQTGLQLNPNDVNNESAESFSSADEDNIHLDRPTSPNMTELGVGNYVVVKLMGKKTVKHYIGLVIEKMSLDEYSVQFLKRRTGSENAFVWPNKEDKSDVPYEEIVGVLPQPTVDRRESQSTE